MGWAAMSITGIEVGAVDHHGRSKGAAAVEASHCFGNVVGQRIGAEPGMVTQPHYIGLAIGGRRQPFGSGRAIAALGSGKLFDKDFTRERLRVILCENYGD